MKRATRKLLSSNTTLTLLILMGIVNASEVTQTPLTNHKDDVVTSSSTLKLEARSEENDLINLSTKNKPTNETGIYSASSISESRANIRTIKSPMQDSYLNALEYSHSSNNPREGIVDVDVKPKPLKIIRRTYDGPIYRPHSEYGPPKEPTTSYGEPDSVDDPLKAPRILYGVPDVAVPTKESFRPTPSNSYSLPIQQTSNFNNQNLYGGGNKYGAPPQSNYGIPSASYGTPSATYGPAPVPQKIYGPPHNSYLPVPQQQQQGEARGYGPSQWSGFALPDLPQLPSLPSIDFSFPLALKLNAFTIAKIILKLVIFKMIVKFIAVLCLLLFIPKLEIKKEENDDADDDNDEGRKFLTHHFTTERLNNLTSLVLDSIEMYRSANNEIFKDKEKCTSMSCYMRSFFLSGETWINYLKLFNNYVNEENDTTSSSEEKSPTKVT